MVVSKQVLFLYRMGVYKVVFVILQNELGGGDGQKVGFVHHTMVSDVAVVTK